MLTREQASKIPATPVSKIQATKIVDIYCRVSTEDQEENTSLQEQETASREYCRQNNLIVGMVHKEIKSGYMYREREKLSLMRQRYQEGKIQGVVIRTLDRLSRKQIHAAILLEEMEHHDITLYCVMEPVNSEDKAMAQFIRSVLAFVAEMEREKIMDRTMTGRINKAKQGKIVTGRKPRYGWKWVLNEKGEKDFLALDKEPVKVLKDLAFKYLNGASFRQLEREMNASKIPSPEGLVGKWTAKTIRRFLIDERMIGKATQFFDKNNKAKKHYEEMELPEGTYPPILDEETYKKILARTESNKQDGKRRCENPELYLLRAGFLRCKSGMTMSVGTIRRTLYYQCKDSHACQGSHYVNTKEVDSFVWSWLQTLTDHSNLIKQAIELVTSKALIESDAKAIDASIANWQNTADGYLQDLKDGTLAERARTAIRASLNEAYSMLEKLEDERAKIAAGMVDREREKAAYQEILAWCEKMATGKEENGEELSYQRKRDFMRLLGLRVVVDRDKKVDGKGGYHIEVELPSIQSLTPCIEEHCC